MMFTLKDAIKNKICVVDMIPNYPMRELVAWLDNLKLDASNLVGMLDKIQAELDLEAAGIAASGFPGEPDILVTKRYWCLYCAQVRSYYNAILRDPENKNRLWFLLR